MSRDGRRPAILAIDTATTQVVIATGSPDGVADGASTWAAGYRHGETLLPSIGRILGEGNIRRSRLTGIVVGTGPGAFTGLRVGIATAKGLAHGLGIPLVGVSTAEALLRGAHGRRGAACCCCRPARRTGWSSAPAARRRRCRRASSRSWPMARRWSRSTSRDGRPTTRSSAARRPGGGSGRSCSGSAPPGSERLATSELETLVPEYVTLPRGVRAADGTVAWSRDPR